jgi:uncharacterized membrane protein
MSRTFATRKLISASPEAVWDVISDVARWPEWTPTVTSVIPLDDGPLAVGSRVRIRQPRLASATWEVTELADGRRFTWESRAPGVRTIGRHEVAAAAGGAEVTLSIEQTGPLAPVVSLLWGRLTQRYVDLEAESLAERFPDTPPA